jgi:hypothetical protein
VVRIGAIERSDHNVRVEHADTHEASQPRSSERNLSRYPGS